MHTGARRANVATTLAVAGGVAALGLAAVVQSPADSCPTLAAAVEAAEARAMARNDGRPVLWGEPRAGVAFEHYAAAMRRMRSPDTFTWDRQLELVRNRGRVVRPHELRPLRAEWSDVLAELAAGARCRDATPRPWRGGGPFSLAWLAYAELELRLAEGRALDAVRACLDVATFLVDLDLPTSIDVRAWSSYVVLHLPHDAADDLAVGLERLEARLLAAPDPAAALRGSVRPLLDGQYSRFDWHWQDVLASEPWEFDPSQRHLAAFGDVYARLDSLEPPAPIGAARDAQWRAFDAALPRTISSHLVDGAVKRAAADERSQRCQLARLRRLRLALAFRAGAPLPPLHDPHTGVPFTTMVEGDTLVVTAGDPWVGTTRWLRRN